MVSDGLSIRPDRAEGAQFTRREDPLGEKRPLCREDALGVERPRRVVFMLEEHEDVAAVA
jgi:hypothetical protein